MTQRERFEAWSANSTRAVWIDLTPIEYAGGEFHYYADINTQLAFEAFCAACPVGWQAVPKTGTKEMEAAAYKAAGEPYIWDNWQLQWESALAVAPKPEEGDV